jgi:hypothetical protein
MEASSESSTCILKPAYSPAQTIFSEVGTFTTTFTVDELRVIKYPNERMHSCPSNRTLEKPAKLNLVAKAYN